MEEEKIPLIEPEAAARIPCRVPRRPKRFGALSGRIRMTLALGLCMAALLCRILWPESAASLRRWVVGDGSEQVQQAFFSMEQALEEGEGLGEAWAAFCTELSDEPA